MSLQNATLLTGVTSFAPTGGTSVAFTGLGITDGKLKAVVTSDTDLRTRRHFTAQVREARPVASAVGGYSLQRHNFKLVVPKLKTLPGGAVVAVNNTLSIEFSFDVETTPTERQVFLDAMAQLGFDADFTSFFKDGNLT